MQSSWLFPPARMNDHPGGRRQASSSRKTYFYINSPRGRPFPEQELIELDRAGYTVVLSRVAIESAPPYVPASARAELCALLRRVAPGELLVVLELAALGCSARDVLSTVTQCRKAKIALRCVELGAADLTARPPSRRQSRRSGRSSIWNKRFAVSEAPAV
ncbi:hypothetical protein [Paraburkholderia bengalensis]|uniref:hypothetical protein n=1 Tax=Paraburkholderia bengalensis TaxID=2747562 RepID=UPI0030152A3B